MQIRVVGVRRDASVPAETTTRGHLRVETVFVSLSRSKLQVARFFGRGHAAPHDRPQIYHQLAGLLYYS